MQRCDNSLQRHRDSAHLQHVLHVLSCRMKNLCLYPPVSPNKAPKSIFFGGVRGRQGIGEMSITMFDYWVPSGKLSHNYGKSPFFIGKSTISKRPCSSSQTVKLSEGIPIYSHDFPIKPYKTTKNSKLFNYQAG